MASKDSFLRRIWDSCVPVCFQLAPDEATSDDSTPPPFFMLVPRVTYFPLVLEKVLRQISTQQESKQRIILHSGMTWDKGRESPCSDDLDRGQQPNADTSNSPTIDHTYWLESEPHSLKWHYPVGLLYDLYGSRNNLPWNLYIHFKNFPHDTLLAPPVNKSAIEAIFMSTVKEADALKHRGAVVNEMLPRDHRQLWLGLSSHTFEQFWAVNRRFMQPFTQKHKPRLNRSSSHETSEGNEDSDQQITPVISAEEPSSLLVALGMKAFRYCPFRLYFSPLSLESTCSTITLGEDVLQVTPEPRIPAFIQVLLDPFKESSDLPICFTDIIETLFASPALRNADLNKSDFVFLVHGVELPQETPGQWISENLSYPDNFVHIVARRRISIVQS